MAQRDNSQKVIENEYEAADRVAVVKESWWMKWEKRKRPRVGWHIHQSSASGVCDGHRCFGGGDPLGNSAWTSVTEVAQKIEPVNLGNQFASRRTTSQRESGVKLSHSTGSVGGTSFAGPDWKSPANWQLKSLPLCLRPARRFSALGFWERHPNHLNSDFFIVARPVPVAPNVF